MKFNKLNFQNETDTFETFSIYRNKQFSLSLCDFNKGELAEATILATEICNWLDQHCEDAKSFVGSKLLALKNDAWLEEGQQPIAEQIFIESIELDAVIGFSDGSFEIYFNDNDLFWGHLVKVDIDKEFRFSSVNIVG